MSYFICPVCAEKHGAAAPALNREGAVLRCEKGHSFDISSKGYVNLLLSQHKNTKDPGDSKEMAAARRLFLSSGAYQPLKDSLCAAAAECCRESSAPVIADCGCGEGYYTEGLYDALCRGGNTPEIFAVDISKNVLAAAKPRFRERKIHAAAASCFRMPLPDECVDLATVVFAPFCREELLRIVKQGGYVIDVIPAREHLYELKELLYEHPYYNEVKPYGVDGLALADKREVSYELTITEQEMLNALFTMTPYYYKTSPADSAALYSYFGTHSVFKVRAAFEILIYRKERER